MSTNETGVKKYELYGHRYIGKIRKNISTEVEVNGTKVHAKVGIKSKEYWFEKQDISDMYYKKKFLIYVIDYVLTAFMLFLLVASLASGISEMVAGVVAWGIIHFGILARCRYLVLVLKTGGEVLIPVSYPKDAEEFLQELKTF